MRRTNLLALILLLLLCTVSQGAFSFVAWADNRPYNIDNEARFIWMLKQMNVIVGDGPLPLFHVVPGDYDDTSTTHEDIQTWSDIKTWHRAPGNHDTGDLDWPNSTKDLPDGEQTPQARFIFLNEYKCQLYGDDYTRCDCRSGRVCEHTLAWLGSECSLAPGELPIFVVGHEPAHPANRHMSDSLNLYSDDRDAFWILLEQYGATYI